MLKLCILSALASIVYCTCPDGWTAFRDSCFFLSRDNETLPGSLTLCETLGKQYGRFATLATVNDQATQKEMEKILAAAGVSGVFTGVYIGAIDIVNEGNFTWVSNGQPIQYTKWGPQQPNNRYGNENCVGIFNAPSYGYNYSWGDEPCTEKYMYICEMTAANIGSAFG